MPDVPGPTTLEGHGRILPQHIERGAGEGVHRAMRGGVRRRLVTDGGWEKSRRRRSQNEDKGLDNKEWTTQLHLTEKHNPLY